MANGLRVEAACAICGAAPSVPECPHEGQRLELALDQAIERWSGVQVIRDWVLNHARNQIIATFHQLRAIRIETHTNYLQTLPYYTLYNRYNGQPPLQPAQLQLIRSQIHQANQLLQAGVDEDWRASCLRYPQVLDYYFSLVQIEFPGDTDPVIRDPRFGGGGGGGGGMGAIENGSATRRSSKQQRRKSIEMAIPEHRKKEKWRSGRTPPPQVPMPGTYRR